MERGVKFFLFFCSSFLFSVLSLFPFPRRCAASDSRFRFIIAVFVFFFLIYRITHQTLRCKKNAHTFFFFSSFLSFFPSSSSCFHSLFPLLLLHPHHASSPPPGPQQPQPPLLGAVRDPSAGEGVEGRRVNLVLGARDRGDDD